MILRVWIVLIFLSSFAFASYEKELIFKGNRLLSDRYLYEKLDLTLKKSWYDFSKQKSKKIDASAVDKLYKTLKNLYKSEGFYKVSINYDVQKSSVIFNIRENSPVIIEKIDIDSDLNLDSFLDFKKGDRFVVDRFIKARESIKRYLKDNGYCNSDFSTKAYVDIEKNSAELVYKLKKNRKCLFGKIKIDNPKNISKKVIFSRLLYKEGEFYNVKKVEKSYKNIMALEAFDSVNIKENNFGDKIDTDISTLLSKRDKIFNIGVGYETKYGIKALMHWEKRNLFRDAKKISFDIKYSDKDRYIKNIFLYPAYTKLPFFEGYFDLKNEFLYGKTEYDDFTDRRFLNKIHFQRQYYDFLLDAGIGFEHIDIDNLKNLCSINGGVFNITSLFVRYILDRRDSKMDPKRGYYLSFYLENSLKYLASSTSYTKLFSEARYIKSFGGLTAAFKIKIGDIEEYDDHLPESKLFFAGGSFSNRAYGYNKLGASDAVCSGVGGRSLIDGSVELEHKFIGKLYGAVFWDYTLISKKESDFSGNFVNSAGLGLRYKTIVGPLKFDIAFNTEDSSVYAIHFQIGQSF